MSNNTINNENHNPDVIKKTIKNLSNKNFKIHVSFSKIFFPCFIKKNQKSRIYERLTMKMLKFISFENLLKLTKKTKVLYNLLMNGSLKYISGLSLYPQNLFKKPSDPNTLQENFIELVTTNNQYAINVLNNLDQVNKFPAFD